MVPRVRSLIALWRETLDSFRRPES